MKVAHMQLANRAYQPCDKVVAGCAGNRGECSSQPCIFMIPYHCTLHFLRRDFFNNGVVIEYRSGFSYTCALISIHFFEVAIRLTCADARDIGNGFGIWSQHGAIEEHLDVLRVEPQS